MVSTIDSITITCCAFDYLSYSAPQSDGCFWHISSSFSWKILNLTQLHLNIGIFVWTQVEQLERQVAELRQALAAKQEQENAMLQVTIFITCLMMYRNIIS